MAAMLDLTKIRKSYLPVRLPDNTVVNVGTPQKHMYEEFVRIDPILKGLSDDSIEDTNEALDILYSYVALILSNNKEQREISEEFVRDELQMEGALMVTYAFADFLNAKKAAEAKN